MSAPVLSRLFTVKGKAVLGTTVLTPSDPAVRKSTFQPKPSNSLCSAGPSRERPLYPTLRANPFPEVTDLFCRLPLPTLFYQLEAANLGDLMRLSVRPGVRISHATEFSRAIRSAPKQSKSDCLCQTLNRISDQFYSTVQSAVNKKRNLLSGFWPR